MKLQILMLLMIHYHVSANKIQEPSPHSNEHMELMPNTPQSITENKQQNWQDFWQQQRGFPDRLLLPRGKTEGMPMQLFVMITAVAPQESVALQKHNGGQKLRKCITDGKAYGFPFDRVIDDVEKFQQPNMYFKDVKIFHDENYIKQNFRA